MSTLVQRSVLDASGFPLDQIQILGIAARGFHGVLESEREAGQDFSADVTLYLDTRAAARDDDLDETVNYALVAQDVVDILSGAPVDLIETVAEQIAAAILDRPLVASVDVTVHKPQAPIPVPFSDVTVTINRDRLNVPVVASPVAPALDEIPLADRAGEPAAPAADATVLPAETDEPPVELTALPAVVPAAVPAPADLPEAFEPVALRVDEVDHAAEAEAPRPSANPTIDLPLGVLTAPVAAREADPASYGESELHLESDLVHDDDETSEVSEHASEAIPAAPSVLPTADAVPPLDEAALAEQARLSDEVRRPEVFGLRPRTQVHERSGASDLSDADGDVDDREPPTAQDDDLAGGTDLAEQDAAAGDQVPSTVAAGDAEVPTPQDRPEPAADDTTSGADEKPAVDGPRTPSERPGGPQPSAAFFAAASAAVLNASRDRAPLSFAELLNPTAATAPPAAQTTERGAGEERSERDEISDDAPSEAAQPQVEPTGPGVPATRAEHDAAAGDEGALVDNSSSVAVRGDSDEDDLRGDLAGSGAVAGLADRDDVAPTDRAHEDSASGAAVHEDSTHDDVVHEDLAHDDVAHDDAVQHDSTPVGAAQGSAAQEHIGRGDSELEHGSLGDAVRRDGADEDGARDAAAHDVTQHAESAHDETAHDETVHHETVHDTAGFDDAAHDLTGDRAPALEGSASEVTSSGSVADVVGDPSSEDDVPYVPEFAFAPLAPFTPPAAAEQAASEQQPEPARWSERRTDEPQSDEPQSDEPQTDALSTGLPVSEDDRADGPGLDETAVLEPVPSVEPAAEDEPVETHHSAPVGDPAGFFDPADPADPADPDPAGPAELDEQPGDAESTDGTDEVLDPADGDSALDDLDDLDDIDHLDQAEQAGSGAVPEAAALAHAPGVDQLTTPTSPVPVVPVPDDAGQTGETAVMAPVLGGVPSLDRGTPTVAGPLGDLSEPEDAHQMPLQLDRMDARPDEPVDAVLALGANLGDAQGTLRRAVAELGTLTGVDVVEVGPLARTAAVGGPEQPDFLNTVVIVRTTLSPRELLLGCQSVEAGNGRVRDVRWGPRTLDIDIVVYGDVIGSAPDLELPHPRANERAFVLAPWAHLSPDAHLPGLGGGPVAALAATAHDREGIRWLALDWLHDAEVPTAAQTRRPATVAPALTAVQVVSVAQPETSQQPESDHEPETSQDLETSQDHESDQDLETSQQADTDSFGAVTAHGLEPASGQPSGAVDTDLGGTGDQEPTEARPASSDEGVVWPGDRPGTEPSALQDGDTPASPDRPV